MNHAPCQTHRTCTGLLCGILLTLATGPAWAEQTPGFVDWSESTYVVWPVQEDGPTKTSVASWSDWMVFDHAVFDRPGVRKVVNQMGASGIRQLWWRTFGGGWSLYPSQVDGTTTGNYAGQGADYGQYDSLADAVEIAHELDMKVYAWFTPLEEAHAWPDNVRSHYVDAHRELWDLSSAGARLGAPSFYYQQYRDYKAAQAEEMVSRYDVDGLVIDLERGGSPRRNDQWGYLPQIVEAFEEETGLDAHELDESDPRWQRFRARYVGEFMRQVREAIDRQDRPIELAAMFNAETPLTAHRDIETWIEQGLLDRLVLVSHGSERWGYPADRAAEVLGEYADYDLPLSLVFYTQQGGRELVEQRSRDAYEAGFDDLVWFETTYLHFQDTYDIPRRLGTSAEATLLSPALDMAGGGELTILAAGDWTLRLDGQDAPLAEGEADRVYRLHLSALEDEARLRFDVSIEHGQQYAGLAVQGHVEGASGARTAVHTDHDWQTPAENATLQTIARPGIPPLLAESIHETLDADPN